MGRGGRVDVCLFVYFLICVCVTAGAKPHGLAPAHTAPGMINIYGLAPAHTAPVQQFG